MKFSAVILAGGYSRRMGRDKAFLEWRGRTLLAQQLDTLQQLQPAELWISGKPGIDYAAGAYPVLFDHFPEHGPLGGIERALHETQTLLLLVLAVDMPLMNASCLQRMLNACADGAGVVPETARQLQPLAAFYPKSAHSTARALLEKGENSVTHFAQSCLQLGLLNRYSVPEAEADFFANWNFPGDVSSAS